MRQLVGDDKCAPVSVDALEVQFMHAFAPVSVDALVCSWPPPPTRTAASEPQLMHLFAPGSSAPVDAFNCSWPSAFFSYFINEWVILQSL